MGRLRVVKLLLSAGANIFSVNHAEQTALMRSVMFSNNYDVRKFPELYQLLHRSTLNIDKSNRTVFHHIADVALSKGKTHAARYYMETILLHLEDFPRELEDVINFQDEDGETALTLASRARSKRLIRALLDHGADPKIKNRDGKCAEDYILEDERFRSSPTLGDRLRNGAPEVAHFAPQLYHSTAAKMAAGKYVTDVAEMLNSLAQGFDAELQGKEREVNQAEGLLETLKTDIEEAKRTLAEVSQRNAAIEAEQQRVLSLETQLKGNMAQKYRQSWEAWLARHEERQREWEAAGKPDVPEFADVVALNAAASPDEDRTLLAEIVQGKRNRAALFKQFVTQQAEVGLLAHAFWSAC
jgi:transcription factor MBP1